MNVNGLTLSPVLCDGMVLQRDVNNRIYGTETQAETVSVCFMGKEYCGMVNDKDEFCIELPPVSAGGPYSMTVTGSGRITISDILFGDVYVLSGQSNMELPVRRVLDVSAEEISNTCEPSIRQYLVPAAFKFEEPEKYLYAGTWKKAAGNDLMEFSAAGYFFAKEIKENYQIPVGLVMTAVGGSHIEAWMSPAALKRFGEYEKVIEAFKDINYFNKYINEQWARVDAWLLNIEQTEKKFSENENYKEWDTCIVPSLVSDYGSHSFSGSVYLCREVYLDTEPVDGNAYIYMGSIIDSDRLWINGKPVGRTDYRYPPRKYPIEEGILRKGSNLITVRLVVNNGNGGTIKGKPYYLYCNGKQHDLKGEWFYRIGKRADEPVPEALFPPSLPICFYNTVVAPVSKLSVKGVLWYQGESNIDDPSDYSERFAAMVSGWRELSGWDVPFIYVQLANYREPLNTGEDTGWAELRDQQFMNLSIYNAAMVTALDIGEANDIHPQNKKALGIRLANAARFLIYGEDVVPGGPVPVKVTTSGKNLDISFQYLEASEEELGLNNFELAGKDGVYYRASAVRRGSLVTVACGEVENPAYVRYAWCDSPADINFYNEAGLPAPGFRLQVTTDNIL